MLCSASHRAIRPLCRAYRPVPLASRRKLTVSAMAPSEVQSAQDASDLLAKGYKYVDVRTPEEFAAGHVPGSCNIPLSPQLPSEFKARFKEDDSLLVGCQSGMRAGKAVDALGGAFKDVIIFRGSFSAWAAAGMPVEK